MAGPDRRGANRTMRRDAAGGRVPLHHRPQVRREVPGQYADATQPAAQPVGDPRHGDRTAAGGGGRGVWSGRGRRHCPSRRRPSVTASAAAEMPQSAFLDFLAHSSAVLRQRGSGRERDRSTIDRQLLKAYQRVWVVAVDPDDTACRTIDLARERTKLCRTCGWPRDWIPKSTSRNRNSSPWLLRVRRFAWKTLPRRRFEIYDSLAKVHALMVTLVQQSAAGGVRVPVELGPAETRGTTREVLEVRLP